LEQRARLHQMDADGSERYSRCAKSIVQVGPPSAGSLGQVTEPDGLTLEIVPEANPYGVPQPATLPVRVIYEGHSLAGALVKLTNLANDASPYEVHLTDQDGRAVFTMPNSDTWLLNVIWIKALPRSEETDFETVFSSLSFGFSIRSSLRDGCADLSARRYSIDAVRLIDRLPCRIPATAGPLVPFISPNCLREGAHKLLEAAQWPEPYPSMGESDGARLPTNEVLQSARLK
jgi:Domain of unknown function (DUF4198)